MTILSHQAGENARHTKPCLSPGLRLRAMAAALVFSAAIGSAQRFSVGDIDAEKPAGQLLQQIGQEADEGKKLALLEQFAEKFPGEKATPAVYEQMQAIYVKTNQSDKVITNSEKLLAIEPLYDVAAHQGLKAAEAKKDPDLIRKWAGILSQTTQKVISSPQPKSADDVKEWKDRVDWATQAKTYADYSLFAASLQATDPKKKIELIQTLETQNPKSEYLAQTTMPLFFAYRQTGANDKALALAEKVLATDQSNEDMLLMVTDSYLQNKKEPDKVHAYSTKIVEIMNAKPAPQGISDADWQARKKSVTGIAYYMNGKLYFTENKFAETDKQLRPALPLIQDQVKAEVLFYLAMANYKLNKPQDAADFNKQCAAIKSPFAATCAKNLAAIRSQYHGLK
jgi:tetratricopeptide (TPR) repeat protein